MRMSASPGFPVVHVPRPTLRRLLAAPVRLQSYRNLLYLALTFPLGLGYFIVLSVGLSLGVGLSILLVGIPLFLAVLVLAHGLATLERIQARVLLGLSVPDPGYAFMEVEGLRARIEGLLLDHMTLRSVIHLVTKLAFGVASFTTIVAGGVTTAVFLAVPLYYDRPGVNVGLFQTEPIEITSGIYVPWDDLLVGVEAAFRITEWQVDTFPESLVMSLLGVVLFVLLVNALNGLAWLAGEYTRVLLGGGRLRDLSVAME